WRKNEHLKNKSLERSGSKSKTKRSRSPTWPYFLQPTYASRLGSPPPVKYTADYFGADLNNSNTNNGISFKIVVFTVRDSMAPVWELCSDSAFLNDSALHSIRSVERRNDRCIDAISSGVYPRLSDQENLKRRLVSGGAGYQNWSSVRQNIARGDTSIKQNVRTDHSSSSSKCILTGDTKEYAISKRNMNFHNKNKRQYNTKTRAEAENIKIINSKIKQSLQKFHKLHHHQNPYDHQICDNQDRSRNGHHLHSHPSYYDDPQKVSQRREKCVESNHLRHRGRKSHPRNQGGRRGVTWQDTAHEFGGNQSLNKGYFQDDGVSDMSNNWFFDWLRSKKEDPIKEEERFYGGLQSIRRSRIDPEKEKLALDMRFRDATSPYSAFPPPPPMRPGQIAGEDAFYNPVEPHHDDDHSADVNILGVSTNDGITGRRLIAHQPLPYGSFKTISMLLESPKLASQTKDLSVFVTAHDMPPLATRLQPYVPFDTAQPTLTKVEPRVKTVGEEEEPTARLPPVQFRPQVGEVKGPSPKPFHHQGIAWPLAFASQPPYACPGHEAVGVQQPVGVLQTGLVPNRPLKARAWELDTEIPAWISPLYKPYGIGGPSGRHGPLAEPKLMENDSRWDDVLRQAEAIGALDIPGVITDAGRLNLTGLCGGYIQLKKEEDARLARQQRWTCKPCTAVHNWFKKVKTKLGIKATATSEVTAKKETDEKREDGVGEKKEEGGN
ncbi:hypothetical protein EGW08_009359, partial [Elysia chlorotica]